MRLTGMTIHRLMTVLAGEQVQLRRDDHSDTTVPAAVPTDDRSDAAAEH